MTIQKLNEILLVEKQDYGVYWIANKLKQLNVPLNYGTETEGYLFSAWVSKRDFQYIYPKLDKRVWKSDRNYHRTEFLKSYGYIHAALHVGNNGNCCISITYKK